MKFRYFQICQQLVLRCRKISRKVGLGEGGGVLVSYFSHQRISQRAVRISLENIKGVRSNISKETYTNCDFTGGGGGEGKGRDPCRPLLIRPW